MDSKLLALDSAENLKQTVNKEGQRKATEGKGDDIAKAMKDLTKPSEIADFGTQFGLDVEDVLNRGKTAKNFGQFRMLIGNLSRGIVGRIEKAKQQGFVVTPQQAKDPKTYSATLRDLKKAAKGDKATASEVASGGDGTEKDAPVIKSAAGLVGGAPSKSEAAAKGRGKGGKKAPVTANAGNTGGAAGVAAEGVQQ